MQIGGIFTLYSVEFNVFVLLFVFFLLSAFTPCFSCHNASLMRMRILMGHKNHTKFYSHRPSTIPQFVFLINRSSVQITETIIVSEIQCVAERDR